MQFIKIEYIINIINTIKSTERCGKLKARNAIIFGIILIIIRFVLTSEFAPYFRVGYKFDDMININITDNLIKGEYLGDYNELTLVKGIGHPLFSAILNQINVPYLVGFDVFFVFSLILLILSLRKHISSNTLLLIIFALILFNPIMLSKEIYLLFYRNGLNTILLILFFSCLFNYINSKKIYANVLLGFSIFLLAITREDFFWILPVTVLILVFKKEHIFKKLITITTPLIFIGFIIFLNYSNYGALTHNELVNSQFSKTYILISRINLPDENLSIKEKIELASSNSKTFLPIYEKMSEYDLFDNKNTKSNHYFWALRDAAAELGYFSSYKNSSSIFLKIEQELQESISDGKIITNSNLPIVIVSSIPSKSFLNIPYLFLRTFSYTISYQDIIITNAHVSQNEYKTLFEKITNSTTNTVDNFKDTNKSNLNILNAVLKVYKFSGIFVAIAGLLSYIYLAIKKQDIKFESALLLSACIYMLGIAFSHATSLNAIRYYYLSPPHITLFIFFLISIAKLILVNRHLLEKRSK